MHTMLSYSVQLLLKKTVFVWTCFFFKKDDHKKNFISKFEHFTTLKTLYAWHHQSYFILLIYFLENRQRGRFAGFSLYVSNTGDISGSTLCYKDGPHLPPLNFSTVCIERGRYFIFYNERLDKVIYPDGYELLNVYIEMCEVIIQGTLLSMIFFILWHIFKHKPVLHLTAARTLVWH